MYVSSASSSVTSRPWRSDSNQRCSRIWWKISAACILPISDGGMAAMIGSKRWSNQRTAVTFSDGAGAGAGLQLGAEAADVVEQAAGLVLPRPQPGQGEQAILVVAALDDAGHEAQPLALLVGEDLHLPDVEAEVVQPAQPLLDLPHLARS